MPPYIIGIRFQPIGKIYHFDASSNQEIVPGDFVVVETSRGRQLGEVIQIVEDPQRPPDGNWKPVQRKATPQDLVLRQIWQRRESEALIACREKAKELALANAKFYAAEYSFDGSRLSFLYSMEEGEKVDFTALRRAMLRVYPHTQLELHQIGPRDVAKLLGGLGACGLSCRCCSMFLTDFSPVSIKMAKEQGISLTPTEITGMCGRLRCCLVYEYDQYVEARKQLPKRNKRVVTSQGEGRVWDVIPMQDSVIVELDDGVRHTFRRDEIEPWDELSALRRKAEMACPKHPEGGCSCRQQAQADGEIAEKEELGYEGESVSFRPEPSEMPRREPPRPERDRNGPPPRSERPRPEPERREAPRPPAEATAAAPKDAAGDKKPGTPRQQHPARHGKHRHGGKPPASGKSQQPSPQQKPSQQQRPPQPGKKPQPPRNKPENT